MDDDIRRLLPEHFLEVYRGAFGADPPRDFLIAYEILCDTLYHGTGLEPELGSGKRGKRFHEGYWFGAGELLGFKTAVDRRIASLRAEIRHYAKSRKRQARRRPLPKGGRGHDLGGPRVVGTRDTGKET